MASLLPLTYDLITKVLVANAFNHMATLWAYAWGLILQTYAFSINNHDIQLGSLCELVIKQKNRVPKIDGMLL